MTFVRTVCRGVLVFVALTWEGWVLALSLLLIASMLEGR